MKHTLTIVSILLLGVLLFTSACTSSEQIQAEQWKTDIELKENPKHPWTDKDFLSADDSFQFAVVADRTGGRRKGVFADGIKKLNLLQPEFVMSVGDLIDAYDNNGQQQWDEFDALVNRLDMPFFYVQGNHDAGRPGIPSQQIWESRYGRTYYHFVYKNVLFLCANSDDPPYMQLSDEQIEYFQKVLKENSDVRWTFVIVHKPWWTTLDDPDPWYVKSRQAWIKFESMLPKKNCTVITGHLHKYEKCIRNGQKYFILGVTGGGFVEEGQKDHIMWITMGPKEPIIANLTLEGISDENFRKSQPQAKSEQKQTDTGVKIIPVDSMSRVYPDKTPQETGAVSPVHVPRGGEASFQFALTTDAATQCMVKTSPILNEQNSFISGSTKIYHLQTVHVEGNHNRSYGSPDQHPGFFIRSAPFDVAEILVETQELTLQKDRTEALLLNIKVDRDAIPGIYEGTLTVQTATGSIDAPFAFHVHKTTLPTTPSLNTIHWLSLQPKDLTNSNIPKKWFTERHWKLIEQAGRSLYESGDRRMNSPILYDTECNGRKCLIQTLVMPDGSLEFDYTRFDRWCEIFLDMGYEKIVGFALGANFPLPSTGSIAAIEKATGKEKILFNMGDGYEEIDAYEGGDKLSDEMLAKLDKNDRETFIPAAWDEFIKSPRYVEVRDRWLYFLETFWIDLAKHLKEKGWYDNYEQQLIDEPRTTKEYIRTARLFRKCMPGVKISDAIHAYLVPDPENFTPYIDNWQTTLSFISRHQDIVKDRRQRGLVTGVYNLETGPPSPNLHIDEHLSHTRLFPWLIYLYGGESSGWY